MMVVLEIQDKNSLSKINQSVQEAVIYMEQLLHRMSELFLLPENDLVKTLNIYPGPLPLYRPR